MNEGVGNEIPLGVAAGTEPLKNCYKYAFGLQELPFFEDQNEFDLTWDRLRGVLRSGRGLNPLLKIIDDFGG